MKNLIVAPHTDDAIFSLGHTIQLLENVTILSVFSGVPEDEEGYNKHMKLLQEHGIACEILGVRQINSKFLDDVYGKQDENKVVRWIEKQLVFGGYDKVYVPLGIHHPDHILTRQMFQKYFKFDYFYEELPYRVRYANIRNQLTLHLSSLYGYKQSRKINANSLKLQRIISKKEEAVRAYYSQLRTPDSGIDEQLVNDIMQEERLWSK